MKIAFLAAGEGARPNNWPLRRMSILLDYLARNGVQVRVISVEDDSTSEDMDDALNSYYPSNDLIMVVKHSQLATLKALVDNHNSSK